MAVTVRSVSREARCATARRKRVEARVFDETGPTRGGLVQPALDRRASCGEGTQVLLHGKMRNRNQFWVTEHELRRPGRRAGAHGRPGAGASRPPTGIYAGRAAQAARGRTTRCSATSSSRCPRALRVAERAAPTAPAALAAAHFPDTEDEAAGARRRLAFEELFLLQLAVAGRRRARREGAPRRAAGRRERRAGRRLARVAAVRADRRPAQGAARRSTPTSRRSAPMQRLLMGEVGSRQDGGGPGTRCCAPSRTAARPR